MAHQFHDENTVMGSGGGVNAVNRIGGNIHSALKTESHIRTPEVVVNGFWQGNNVQTLFTQKIGRFLAAVSTQNNETVQVKIFVGGFHGFYFIKSVFVRDPH